MKKRSPPNSTRNYLLICFGLLATVILTSLASAQSFGGRLTGEDTSDCPDGSCCAAGYAIDVSLGLVEDAAPSLLCSEPCEDDTTCPENWGCRFVSEGSGTKQGICFPRR